MGDSNERKRELLQAVTAHVLQHGLRDLSLRPLAEAVGTSARMLVYHFGSKEDLLRDVLRQLRAEHQRKMLALGVGKKQLSLEQVLLRVWDWTQAEENRATLRFAMDLIAPGDWASDEMRALIRENNEAWVAWLEAVWRSHGWPPRRIRPLAELTISTIHGLQMDAMATGDGARARRSLRLFAKLLREEMGGAW